MIAPMAPGTEMIAPNADAVPTARWIGTPHSVMQGTPTVPPPMPIMVEMPPMPNGINNSAHAARHMVCQPPGLFGECQLRRHRQRDHSEKQCQELSRAAPASTLPASTPTNIGAIQRFNSSQSTAPLLACEVSEENEVGMIVASEVPDRDVHPQAFLHAHHRRARGTSPARSRCRRPPQHARDQACDHARAHQPERQRAEVSARMVVVKSIRTGPASLRRE